MSQSRPNPNDIYNHTDSKKPGFFSRQSERPSQPMSEAATNASSNAKGAAYAMLPSVTASGIAIMSHRGGYLDLSAIGFPIAVGGIIIDTVKAPIAAVVATEETVRSVVLKVASSIFERNPVSQESQRIFQSFLIRMRATINVLVITGLETLQSINAKLQSGNIEELVGLTLLHTAYVSRYDSGLLLANGKTLSRDDCPPEGLLLFDKIIAVRNSINDAFSLVNLPMRSYVSNKERELAEATIVSDWISVIKAGKTVTKTEKPDATEAQLSVANQIIVQIAEMKKRAMTTLPETPVEVVRHLPAPGKN